MKKGFNRLKGVATASVLGLGCLVAGSGRAAPTVLATTFTFPLATGVKISGLNASAVWSDIDTAFEISDATVMLTASIVSTTFTSLTTTTTIGGAINTGVVVTITVSTDEAYSDAFDDALGFSVDGTSFSNPDSTVDLTGSVLTSDAHVDIAPGIDAQVTFAFDSPATAGSLGLVRALYSITNTSAAEIATTVNVNGNLGSDSDTTIQATSSGDLIADDVDLWTYSSDQSVGTDPQLFNDPGLVITRYGAGASIVPVQSNIIADGNGNFANDYALTIPAGETQRIMVFIEMHNVNASAVASASGFESLAAASTANHLDGLSATQLSEIVNYGQDADLDGALDADDAFPNDPAETKDTDGDGIGDNADTTPNGPETTSDASTSSGSSMMNLPGLFATLSLLSVFRLFRKK